MVTLQDIAKESHVSVGTVSNILNGRTRELWPSTRARADRVRAVARRLGYRANAAARATRRGITGSVLLLAARGDASAFSARLIRGLTEALSDQGLTLQVAPMDIDRAENPAATPFNQRTCDAVLLEPSIDPALCDHRLAELGLPRVALHRRLPDRCVRFDDQRAAFDLTAAMLDRGLRRIAYFDLSHPADRLRQAHFSVADREAGYRLAMARAGLTPRVHREATRGTNLDRHRFIAAQLADDDRPEGILTYSYPMPYLFAALERGLSVPGDLTIATFDTHAELHLGAPVLLALGDEAALGREAVALLRAMIDQPYRKPAPPPLARRVLETAP